MSSRPHLLVLDPDPRFLSRLVGQLEAAGLEVQTLTDPTLALTTAAALRPKLVVLEREFPRCLGTDVARALAQDSRTSDLPFAYLTRDASWKELLRAIRSGAVDVVHKALHADAATRLQQLVLDLSRPGDPSGAQAPPPLSGAERWAAAMRRNRATGSVRLNPGTPFEGRAIFEQGELIAADCGPLSGSSALEEMLTYDEGVWTYDATPLPRLVYPPPPSSSSAWGHPLPFTPDSQRAAEFANAHVLFVDDAPELRRLYERQLARAGLRVDLACDGEEALSKVARLQYDLVVTDLNMPRLDGWGLLRRLREHHRTREIPVIFLSAVDDQHEPLKAARAGARDYLLKTGRSGQVLERILATLAPRMETLRALSAGGAFHVPLHLVGTQWFLEAASRLGVSGTIQSQDDWGHCAIDLWEGTPLSARADLSGRCLLGVAALGALLLSRPSTARFIPQQLPLKPGDRPSTVQAAELPRSMDAALAEAIGTLHALEARASHVQDENTPMIHVDQVLYERYRQVGSEGELALAKAVCEDQVAPCELTKRLGQNPDDIQKGLRELFRRRVLTLTEHDDS